MRRRPSQPVLLQAFYVCTNKTNGMETLAVINSIADTMQVVDFMDKIISRIEDCSPCDRGIPRVFQDMQNTLPLIVMSSDEVES